MLLAPTQMFITLLKKTAILLFCSFFLCNSPIIAQENTFYIQKKIKNSKINQQNIESQKIKILNHYANCGFAFTKTWLDSAVVKKNISHFYYKVDTGAKIQIENIIIPYEGKLFRPAIWHATNIKKNTFFNQKKFINAPKAITSLKGFSMFAPPEIEWHNTGADIYLFIDTEKQTQFQALAALVPNNDKYTIQGSALFNMINCFGRGEEWIFEWQGYQPNSQSLKISADVPFIFKTPATPYINISLLKSDTTSLETTINFCTKFRLNSLLESGILFKNKTTSPQNSYSNLLKSKITLWGFLINFVDGLNYIKTNISIGQRSIENKQLQTSEISINSFFIKKISKIIDIETKAYATTILGNYQLQYYEKYTFGGASSLRGFTENAFRADQYAIVSIATRIGINKPLSLFTFIDQACYQLNNTYDTPTGMGIGILLKTKGPAIDIAWAIGRSEGRLHSLKDAMLHIKASFNF